MTTKNICTCNPIQSEIKPDEAVDFIRMDGKIVARYHKECECHGFKRLETKES